MPLIIPKQPVYSKHYLESRHDYFEGWQGTDPLQGSVGKKENIKTISVNTRRKQA
jgi:hypothetical protein